MTPAEELASLAAAQHPIRPTDLSLVLICVTAISLFFSIVTVGLRMWVRSPFAKNTRIWGWDDTTCVIGLLGYLVSCYYAILSALYGIGVPDGNTSTARALAVRAIEYLQYWEIAYIFAIALIKTSVGITILRIAVERRHRHSVWLVLIICNTVYAAGIIFLFASCRPMEARWNPLAGSCGGEFMMTALAYCLITLGCITDAACALIPIDIVRGLQMPRRPKCTLMVVLSLGLLAAFFSGARYPFCAYLPPQAGRLRNLTWIPIFSISEAAVGLVFGSLPAIGSTLRLFGTSSQKEQVAGSSSGMLGNRTFGGTPFSSEDKSKNRLSLIPRGMGQSETRIWSTSEDVERFGDEVPPPVYLRIDRLDSLSTHG